MGLTEYGCPQCNYTTIATKRSACPNCSNTGRDEPLRLKPLDTQTIDVSEIRSVVSTLEDINNKLTTESEYGINVNSIRYQITNAINNNSAVASEGEVLVEDIEHIYQPMQDALDDLSNSGFSEQAEKMRTAIQRLDELLEKYKDG